MHRVQFVAAAALASALHAAPARACDCALLSPPREAFDNADAVFEARILWSVPVAPDPQFSDYGIVVARSWKGVGTRDGAILQNWQFCSAPIEVGETYLIYADRSAKGALNVSRCDRVVKTTDVTADLAEIGPPLEVRDPALPMPSPPAAVPTPSDDGATARSCAASRAVGAPRTGWITAIVVTVGFALRRLRVGTRPR